MSLSRISTKRRVWHLFNSSRRSISTDVVGQEDAEVEYPPVKPKIPPGKWGDVDRKTAWKRYEEEQTVRALPTVKERLNYFNKKGTEYGRKSWAYKSLSYLPRMLEFQQDKTKTVLIEDSLPEVYNSIDVESELATLKPLITEMLLAEHEDINRLKILQDPRNKWMFGNHILRNMIYTIISVISCRHEHLLKGVLSEGVDIEAFWDRFGTERPRKKKEPTHAFEHISPLDPKRAELLERTKYLKVQGFEESAEMFSSFFADFLFRSEKLLPEFIPVSDPICTEGEYPKSRYYPKMMGLDAVWKKFEIKTGYKLGDPYEPVYKTGDPWELGLFCIKNPYKEFMYTYADQIGEHHAVMARTGLGINASFLLTVAQAYSQGFNTCIDITYPFNTQTVLSNGQKFSFYAYQLNTLCLWKCDDSNPLRNICWKLPETNLYDVIENGEVKGFNDDIFKNFLKFILLKPVDRVTNFKPTLPPDSPDYAKRDTPYLEDKVEIIIEEKEQGFDLS